MTELVWEGKYKDGKRVAPVRIALRACSPVPSGSLIQAKSWFSSLPETEIAVDFLSLFLYDST